MTLNNAAERIEVFLQEFITKTHNAARNVTSVETTDHVTTVSFEDGSVLDITFRPR